MHEEADSEIKKKCWNVAIFLPVMELENFSQLDSDSKLLNRRTASDWPAWTHSEISYPTPSAMFDYYRFGVSCGFTIVAPHVLHVAVRWLSGFLSVVFCVYHPLIPFISLLLTPLCDWPETLSVLFWPIFFNFLFWIYFFFLPHKNSSHHLTHLFSPSGCERVKLLIAKRFIVSPNFSAGSRTNK